MSDAKKLRSGLSAGLNKASEGASNPEKEKASSEIKSAKTERLYVSAVDSKLVSNLRRIDSMCADRKTRGMQNALINEALELLTNAYRNGQGKFTFEHPELLE